MNCASCKKEIVPDSVFCAWCSDFVPSPGKGKKANLFARWVALALDPLIAVILYFLGVGIVGAISKNLGIVAAIGLPIVYLVWFLTLFRRGLTPGKKLLGLQVVNYQTGTIPGFGKMFLREIVGRFVSALFFGVGYFWAIFDKNSQAWHDKIAGTVVLKLAAHGAPVPAPPSDKPAQEPVSARPPRGARRVSFSVPQLFAVGIALVLVAGGIVWLSHSHAGGSQATVPQGGASAAAPKAERWSGDEKERTYIAAMKSDLRNLVGAEECYIESGGRKYTSDVTKLGPPRCTPGFTLSPGVTGLTISPTSDGFTARVGHIGTTRTCGVFVGSTPLPPATREGVAECQASSGISTDTRPPHVTTPPPRVGEYSSDSNTVLLLHMNESSGSSLHDASGHGYRVTTTGTTIVDGRFGLARRFSNEVGFVARDYISVTDSPALNPPEALTFEAWIYLTANSEGWTNGMPIFSRDDSYMGVQGYSFGVGSCDANLGLVFYDGELGVCKGWVPGLDLGQWHHVAFTLESNGGQKSVRLYIDCRQVAQAFAPGTLHRNHLTTFIGRRFGSAGAFPYNSGFAGLIDEVRVSNRVRSPAEFNCRATH
jgi:uncharacterized RDD family membrane protein YckC